MAAIKNPARLREKGHTLAGTVMVPSTGFAADGYLL
jgi:hypothetical protein